MLDINGQESKTRLDRLNPSGLEQRIATIKGYVYLEPREVYESKDGRWTLLSGDNPALVIPDKQRHEPVPPWAREEGAALTLVEEIRRAGAPVCILCLPEGCERNGRYEVKIYVLKEDGFQPFICTWAEELPRAIAMAYILWEERRVKPKFLGGLA